MIELLVALIVATAFGVVIANAAGLSLVSGFFFTVFFILGVIFSIAGVLVWLTSEPPESKLPPVLLALFSLCMCVFTLVVSGRI